MPWSAGYAIGQGQVPRRQRRRMSGGQDGADETVNLVAEDPGLMAQQIGGGVLT
jgi:hypothetical protein